MQPSLRPTRSKRKGNVALISDHENQFGSLAETRPCFGIPSRWRSFIFVCCHSVRQSPRTGVNSSSRAQEIRGPSSERSEYLTLFPEARWLKKVYPRRRSSTTSSRSSRNRSWRIYANCTCSCDTFLFLIVRHASWPVLDREFLTFLH